MSGQHALSRTGDYDSLYRDYLALLKEVDHLSTLREIALAINSSLELEEVLPIIANVVQGALEVRKLTIYELDERSTMAIPVVAKYGEDVFRHEDLEDERAHLLGSPLGGAIRTRMPVVVSSEIQSSACVPLIAKGTPIGVMRLEDREDGAPFTDEDQQLLQSIGSMIAIAINNAQLYALGVTDGLTGLYLRRYFDVRMEEKFAQSKRYNRDFSLLLFDIDHFKSINDTHGHQTGDMVLEQFAQILSDSTRKADIACRYGGDEMALILPETPLDRAAILGEKLCEMMRSYVFEGPCGEEIAVTTSIGVSAFQPSLDSADQMIRAADEALYTAKRQGRDRVVIAE